MSAEHNCLKSPWFAALAAALAFSVSSWSGQSESGVQTLSLSSQVRVCDVEQKLKRSKDGFAECEFSDGEVRGNVRVRHEKQPIYDRSSGEAKESTESAWIVSVDCAECGKPVERSFGDMREAAQQAERMLVEKVQEAKTKKAEATAKAEREQRCEIANGKELKEKTEVLNCKIDRLKGMPREDAVAFFESEIKPDVQAMLSCDSISNSGMLASMIMSNPKVITNNDSRCSAERTKANRLLGKLESSAGSHPVIASAAADMARFGLYAAAIQQLNMSYAAIANWPPNDPRRQEAVRHLSAQLMGLKSNWGVYFAQRGLAIQDSFSPLDWESMSLRGNLDSYNNSLNSIVDSHYRFLQAGMYNGVNGVNGANNGNAANSQFGRLARGNPSMNYGGGPTASTQFNAGQPVTSTPVFGQGQLNQVPFQANRAGALPFGSGVQAAPANRPLNGSSIAKPAFGSSAATRR